MWLLQCSDNEYLDPMHVRELNTAVWYGEVHWNSSMQRPHLYNATFTSQAQHNWSWHQAKWLPQGRRRSKSLTRFLTCWVVSKVGLALGGGVGEELWVLLVCAAYVEVARSHWKEGFGHKEELLRHKLNSSLCVSSGTGRDLLLPREARS